MGYIFCDSEKGVTLRDILKYYNNQDFDVIECRCKWEENGQKYDELFGYCQYINCELRPLDGDTYSLDDKYVKWHLWVDLEEEHYDGGKQCLTVWEEGIHSEEWER